MSTKQTSKQHIAVLMKEQDKDEAQGLAVKHPKSFTKAFQGNQHANAQPQDGPLQIGLTTWRRP